MQVRHLDPIGNAEIYAKQQSRKNINNLFKKQSEKALKSDGNLNKAPSKK